VNIGAFPLRRPPIVPEHLDLRVPIVSSWLGDDGGLLRAVAASDAAGCVVETLGAGHLGPRALAALREVAERMPVVATTRPAAARSSTRPTASRAARRTSGRWRSPPGRCPPRPRA
jgi:L-asparaginase/Glu-tRNA(Gln) amidotransferase subunit D